MAAALARRGPRCRTIGSTRRWPLSRRPARLTLPRRSSLQLTEQVHRAQTAARLSAELDGVLADLAERLGDGDLTAASDRLGKATALAPADSRVQAAKQRIEQASAARDAAAARARTSKPNRPPRRHRSIEATCRRRCDW